MHMSFLLTGAEGGDIPAGVLMQELTPEAPEAAEGAPEPMAEVVEKTARGEAVTTSPEVALEVAIRSPEIQDANVVWTSLSPLHRWVPGPTTRWASGTTRLALHGT
jgi:hypothetical protein